jgi:hypothetical protein
MDNTGSGPTSGREQRKAADMAIHTHTETHAETQTETRLGSLLANNPVYRVAQDLSGDWWVWRQTSSTTWTTFQRFDSEDSARAAHKTLALPRA